MDNNSIPVIDMLWVCYISYYIIYISGLNFMFVMIFLILFFTFSSIIQINISRLITTGLPIFFPTKEEFTSIFS